ncbi:acyl-CoA dehydrogenase family protein [Fodinibius salsisoli]|uniref:Acyl-CoA dehydrogenase family protein n=1 Tax=Fodinibius salsisoli TaxID=2820877 RepID=A0ABT3PL95_9BACT|nr:acyl-CoA dehydrogenase family protein [Fodinibius salsisoli]MCW9706702.1 acyl-CoA dehydrogenase family protein [Fodinibius salsisoli]
MTEVTNQVLTDDARQSQNFFTSDQILRHYVNKHLDPAAVDYMEPHLDQLGHEAANRMNDLSQAADQYTPTLNKRTKLGKTVNRVDFHPAYEQLVDIAAQSEMFYVKYHPRLRKQFMGHRHTLGFAAGQLYAMSELGVYCPLCMTDGAAHLVDRYAPESIRERLLPKLSANEGAHLATGAMFLTEKSGGSDVGRNLVTAEQVEGNQYQLNGEKWFCSNVNAEVIMALARTGKQEEGTRGLSLFLVEKDLPDGTANQMNIIRLKEKLGVRSMATGEVEFNDTIGIRLGAEGKGFKLMAEMINISRTYNAIAAIGGTRRAIVEAYQYLNHRLTFGKRAIEHALIRQKFQELGALYVGDFLLAWRAIRAMDAAEEGAQDEQQLMRLLVPMAKWRTAEQSVYIVRECMELMGGNGYIEDFVMPKLLRDVNVLPIWEGSGNIIVLDILRASQKSEGLQLVIEQIREVSDESEEYGEIIKRELTHLLRIWKKLRETEDRDVVEATVKPLFKQLILLYEMALMIEERDKTSKAWIDPALNYLASTLETDIRIQHPANRQEVADLIAWDY